MMEPHRRLEVLLRHMRDAACNAVSYVEGLVVDDFLADGRTREAVAMNLLIAGEAANAISRKHLDFEQCNPRIELKHMRDMRNRIAHGYVDLDFRTIWTIVTDDLPRLIVQLDAVIGDTER